MKKILVTIAAASVVLVPHARADLHRCNGVWTNKPCDSKAKVSERKPSAQAQDLSKRRSLFHDLTTKNIKARKQYGIQMSLEYVEDLCFNTPGASLDQCRKAVEEADDKLEDRMATRALVEAQQKAKIESQKTDANATQVTIIRDPDYIIDQPGYVYDHGGVIVRERPIIPVDPHGRDHHHHRDGPRWNERPRRGDPRPRREPREPTRQRQSIGSGIAIP